MEKLKILLFGVLLSSCLCDGLKILTVFPVPSPSHGILGDNMVKHLLNGGHEVTYITPFKNKNPHPKLHIIDVSANMKLFDPNMLDVKKIMDGDKYMQDNALLFVLMNSIASSTLGNPNVQKMLKDPNTKFDVIIGEFMFSDLYSALPAVLQCPFIWFSTIEAHSMILNQVHGPLNPAYTADYLVARVPPFSFYGRVHELWTLLVGLYHHNFDYHAKEVSDYETLIAPIAREQGKPVPDFNVLKYNASLLLGNTQVAISNAVPLPPCYKHIGGYHIDEEVKPLPEDLQKIMDSAKHGVIYFSMGSNLKSKDLPDELKQGLLKVFGGLKQTVIWKFEENLPNTPKNVHIVQWAPQQSILAHPNLVLFVTHGGLLSITEAVHFGVPLIAIPVFADQYLNANRIEKKGFAIKVDLSRTMDKDLKVALNEVLGNKKYAETAKALSIAYHDRPQKPKDALNFWVEHVVRTRGAPHLRSVAVDIPLYQRVYLDLLALILLALVVLLVVVKKILGLLTSKKSVKQKKN
nr:UDP-glucosyltransferase 2 [Helicoverpa armigera]XP_021191137.2 UDP-glucosyltransferase 2 [Helicoverpa armigera]WRX06273.1 UGT40F2 [Helicoverpa armigera]